MSKLVIVGVDNSEQAPATIAVADWLAERLRCRLALLHAAGDSEAEREGSAMLDAVGPEDAFRRVLHGEPATELAHAALALDATMLVVGSRGRGAITGALMGSVSRSLARRAPCPLLVVPPRAAERLSSLHAPDPGSTIVCGVDASEHARRALEVAAWLAARTELGLVLVHTVESAAMAPIVPAPGVGAPLDHHELLLKKQRDAGRRLLDYAKRAADEWDLEPEVRIESGNESERLDEVAAEEDAVLTVLGTGPSGPLGLGMIGSAPSTLRQEGCRPVLLVPPPGAREPL